MSTKVIGMISWSCFLGYYTGVTVIYWVSIVVFVFRSGFKGRLQQVASGRLSFHRPTQPVTNGVEGRVRNDVRSQQSDELFETVRSEIQGYLVQANSEDAVRNEILYSLKRIVSKYYGVADENTRMHLLDVINDLAEEICAFRFSDDELRGLWIRS